MCDEEYEIGDTVVFPVPGTTMTRVGVVISMYYDNAEGGEEEEEGRMEEDGGGEEEDGEEEMLQLMLLLPRPPATPSELRSKNRLKMPAGVHEYVDWDIIISGVPSESVIRKIAMVIADGSDEGPMDSFTKTERSHGAIYVTAACPANERKPEEDSTCLNVAGKLVEPMSFTDKCRWYHYRPDELGNSRVLYDDTPILDGDIELGLLAVLKTALFDPFVSALSVSRMRKPPCKWNLAGWKLILQRAMGKREDQEFLQFMQDAMLQNGRNTEMYIVYEEMLPFVVMMLREWLSPLANVITTPYLVSKVLAGHVAIVDSILRKHAQMLGMHQCGGGDSDDDDEEEDDTASYEMKKFIAEDKSDVTELSGDEEEEELPNTDEEEEGGSDEDDDDDDQSSENDDDGVSGGGVGGGVKRSKAAVVLSDSDSDDGSSASSSNSSGARWSVVGSDDGSDCSEYKPSSSSSKKRQARRRGGDKGGDDAIVVDD